MAGYRIAFDGSLNERKNIVQSVGNTSLTNSSTVTVSPASWEMSAVLSFTVGALFIPSPVSYEWRTTDANPISQVIASGVNEVTFTDNFIHLHESAFITPLLTGTFNYEVRYRKWTTMLPVVVSKRNSAGSQVSVLASGTQTPVGSFDILSGPVTLANEYISISFSGFDGGIGNTAFDVDYIRITQTVGGVVSIFPATNISGAAPTGGVSETALPSTLVDGQLALAGAPKLFGAKVVHDSSDILEAKYLPPADVSEDAEANAKATKFITATSTTLSVESDGLGSAERLGANETSLIVEEIIGAVEN